MSKNSRKRNFSKLIILAIVLLVPGFLYIAVNKMGSNSYAKLPVFGEKKLTGKMVRKMGREFPDTLFHQIPSLEFTSADSSKINFLAKDSMITVVHLFDPKDTGLSATLLQNLKIIAERFKMNHKVQLYSISVDSLATVQQLKEIADKYADKYIDWHIIGQQSKILDYAKSSLLIDAIEDNGSYIISNNYILIDSQRRIRGFYDINLKTEIDRLEDEIKVQLVEEARNNPLKIEKK